MSHHNPYNKHNKMDTHKQSGKTNEKQCITIKAYELWEKDGRKEGYDLNYWLMAERAIKIQAAQ